MSWLERSKPLKRSKPIRRKLPRRVTRPGPGSGWELVEEKSSRPDVPPPCTERCYHVHADLRATIARLERELERVIIRDAAGDAVITGLIAHRNEHACVDCADQQENDHARGYCPKHGEAKRDEIDRLERELAEAKSKLATRPERCTKGLSGTAWVCTLPGNHQGSHANSFGTWRP